MIRVFANANYDVIGKRKLAYIASAAVIVPGLLLMAVIGLNYSVEFTGGTLVQVRFQDAPAAAAVRQAVADAGIRGAEIQKFGSDQEFVIRARLDEGGEVEVSEATAQRTAAAVVGALNARFGEGAVELQRREAIGPKVGAELRSRAVIAILLSFVATLVYLAFRFEWRFGVAAVIATGHDILATLAFLQYMRLEVSLVVVSAILTVIGYSLNDTIVIFDRVRENLHKYRRQDFKDILNRSINETLPRTVLTGGAVILSLAALLVLAGEVIRPFAWVMLFGVIVGTFSSVFIASPVLLLIEQRWPGHDARGVKARVMPTQPRADAPALPTT